MLKLSEELGDLDDELLSRGFVLQSETYEPEHFGNGTAEYVSADMDVQFSRDRGQTVVNIRRSSTDRWISLETALEYIRNSTKPNFVCRAAGLLFLARLPEIRTSLREHWDDLNILQDRKRTELINRFK
jgi:hypothetical protein